MHKKFDAPRGRAKKNTGLLILIPLLIILCLTACKLRENQPDTQPDPDGSASYLDTEATELPTQTPTETEPPEPEHVVSTATVSATGDLLMHKAIINAARTDGGYNFDFIFRYLKSYAQAADYAAANLETTLAGTAKPYQGNPRFNCPDEIVTAARDAGFDMLLTANNHSFDTGPDGFLRTLEVVRGAGMDTLGTMASAEDPKYAIKDINGIKIGMLCYTYETSDGTGSYPSLNGLPMTGASYENINCYLPSDPSRMYTEVEQYLAEMKEAGVEATIMFIHWGPQEYALTQPKAHVDIAQKLCDLGIDVIIGGHPHVVQPMDLLTSTVDPAHKTVCLYSMGNAVSNQRLGNISYVSTAHTEDGVWISVTFSKYSDGTVYLDSVELIPTWVYLNKEYIILPLDYELVDEWGALYNISDSTVQAAKDSYNRTMALVGDGLAECQEYLAQAKAQREAAYLAAVQPAA
ncbi:MAG: CapA family protein [Oscillospiraceae bacterium]|nr:CapA family protein [Oscillospiraceae bacterium]